MKKAVLLALATAAAGQIYDTYNSITALAGTANGSDASILGNYYNYWKLTNNKTTWDLTRSDRLPVSCPKTIPMLGSRKEAIIEPNRTAFVIVDMQNYFLHPKISPKAANGRRAVQPILNMIDAFRSNGMKILWLHWGIDNFDMVTLPPSFLDTFSTNHEMNTTFCTEMGMLSEDNGTVIDMGKLLCRGSWNAQPWGPLNEALNEGLAAGTDLYFHKNRLSGLWGAQTPLGLYLQESQTTTLFISGVNSDQCVWSTLVDAYFKGFDVVYVEDCTGTTSPWYAEQMARYNADLDGFLANSTYIIDALEMQKK
ncbi:isochorismatase hydrolase [Teratosphaeria destructans]|uniref:Isochorismatase hydrolase n=1 Tax=Teratosphaeria destructans TaxID=418781 RepID=A0A9W7SUY0_9PEZI|nr:isochorismatase hydrolase [Teratosphaeria destructans]